jgi:ABC-type phosphate transport system substrate-binding protein
MSQLTRIAAAMAVLVSVPAFAATAPVAIGTIYGGGATLPIGAYVGSKWLGTTDATSKRQSITSTTKTLDLLNPAAVDSLFAQVTLTSPVGKFFKVSYCGTGSGTGRNVLRGTADATGTCGTYGETPTGFAATTAEADFAGSDAPFAASEVASFGAGSRAATRIAPIQLPAVAAAIGVIFNNSDLGNAKLNLTESQLCQVVSGAITNWNQLGFASKPIVFVKRSDSSGTTFSFTNHLSATCPSTTPVAVTGFVTQNTLTTNVVGTAIVGSGNGGVVAQVLATDGSIGYADVADGAARAALNGGGVLRVATLSIKPDVAAYVEDVPQNNADGSPKLKNGIRVTKAVKHKAIVFTKFDPLNSKHFPASVAVTTVADQVLGSNDGNGRPTLVALTALPGATPGCIQTVAPDTYAKPALNVKNDYVQYPIIAISYLMGYNQGNAIVGGTDKADALRRLFSAPYAISSKVKTIGKKKGFAGLTITAGAGSAATTGAGLVSACVLN